MNGGPRLWVSDEVAATLSGGGAVVALESSLIAQGLPVPHNLETALAAERAVRDEGAVPATVAIDRGLLVIGAPMEALERLADPSSGATKAASRDIGPLLAAGRFASTTVSATMRIASMAGIRVLGTGGIGGVHRGASTSFDVSGDLAELAATPLAVICSGAKSILDLPATFELLESRRIPVVGLGVDELPAFYSTSSGLRLAHRVETAEQAASVIGAHLTLPGAAAILIVQPPPPDLAIPGDEMEAWITSAAAEAGERGVSGGSVTPFILGRLGELSGGQTLRTNIGLIVANARAAARIAVALAAPGAASVA